MKIIFGHFFSYIRVRQTSRNISLSSTWLSGNQFAVCKRIPPKPKRWLKTQTFGKKGYLPSGTFFCVLICRIMEYGKRQGTIYLCAQRIFDKNCPNYNIFSVGPKRSIKTVFFQKMLPFKWKKYISATFSRIIEYDKQQGTIYEGSIELFWKL